MEEILKKVFKILKIFEVFFKGLLVMMIYGIGVFGFIIYDNEFVILFMFIGCLLLGTIVGVFFMRKNDKTNKCEVEIRNIKRETDINEIRFYLEKFKNKYLEKKKIYVLVRTVCIVLIIGIISFIIISYCVLENPLFFVCVILEMPIIAVLLENVDYYNMLASKAKDKFLNDSIKGINSNFKYDDCYEYDEDILDLYFNKAGFFKPFHYKAEDCIMGTIQENINLKMSHINLYGVNGSKKDRFVFVALESEKFISGEVRVLGEKVKTFYEKNEEKHQENEFSMVKDIELDNQSFEKYFDVETSNDILALRILTHDVMKVLLDFAEEYQIPFELKIKDNYLFVKFHVDFEFKPHIYNTKLEVQQLIDEYNVLKIINNFLEQIKIIWK